MRQAVGRTYVGRDLIRSVPIAVGVLDLLWAGHADVQEVWDVRRVDHLLLLSVSCCHEQAVDVFLLNPPGGVTGRLLRRWNPDGSDQ